MDQTKDKPRISYNKESFHYENLNHSIYEIKDILAKEGFNTSIQTVNRIIKDEGFTKLPRRTKEELGLTKKNTLLPEISTAIDFEQLNSYSFECQVGGIYYFIPYILQTGLYELISSLPFPETSKLSKINSHLLHTGYEVNRS